MAGKSTLLLHTLLSARCMVAAVCGKVEVQASALRNGCSSQPAVLAASAAVDAVAVSQGRVQCLH